MLEVLCIGVLGEAARGMERCRNRGWEGRGGVGIICGKEYGKELFIEGCGKMVWQHLRGHGKSRGEACAKSIRTLLHWHLMSLIIVAIISTIAGPLTCCNIPRNWPGR